MNKLFVGVHLLDYEYIKNRFTKWKLITADTSTSLKIHRTNHYKKCYRPIIDSQHYLIGRQIKLAKQPLSYSIVSTKYDFLNVSILNKLYDHLAYKGIKAY